ncbi:hypothetical protein GQX74_007812 [Glossina fuscipes]|nr:hypothetical protein GQX74_007812 [Glossina fuscipes]
MYLNDRDGCHQAVINPRKIVTEAMEMVKLAYNENSKSFINLNLLFGVLLRPYSYTCVNSIVHQFAFLSFKHILEILIQEIKKSAENSWFSQFKSGKACCQSNKKNVFRQGPINVILYGLWQHLCSFVFLKATRCYCYYVSISISQLESVSALLDLFFH